MINDQNGNWTAHLMNLQQRPEATDHPCHFPTGAPKSKRKAGPTMPMQEVEAA